MTYEEVIKKAKTAIKKVDTAAIKEHSAIEIDIEGEGEGAFYVELDNGKVAVEPYEYYDRDAKIIITADELVKIIKGEKKAEESVEDGILMFEGDRTDWQPEHNAVFHKQTFMAIDPFIGCDFIVSKSVHLTLKADCLNSISHGNLLMPIGPRFYLGCIFYH